MRLLFVTQDFPPEVGGIQTYSWEVAQGLAERASHLEIVAPAHPGAEEVDRRAPFTINRVWGRPDLLPGTAFPTVLHRTRHLRPDVTLHAQWQTVGTSALTQWTTGRPHHIACAAHGRELLFNPFASFPGLRPAYERLRRGLLKWPDVFFPVSHYTAGLLHERGVPRERLHVVPNGTNPDHFRPLDGSALRRRLGLGERPLLLTVGRLVPRKGVDTVLQALPRVARTVPEVQYLVVGTGPDASRLERLAERLQVRDRVHFVGEVSHQELPLYYSAADLFVMPAREARPDVEGFGIVFLEANACGTPVIGARTGGIPDAIDEGETGLLVPPDDPMALAASAARILTTPQEAEVLGRQGRERVLREANWDHIAAQLFDGLSRLE